MTLLDLFHLLRKHLKLVILLPLACMLAAGVYSFVMMPNTYSATVSMYVLVQQDNSKSYSLSSDLSASQMVTNDVATLLKSDRVVNETASSLGLENLKGYKTAITSSTTSRVLSLGVTGPDAQMAANIANKMADEVSTVAHDVMNVDSVNVVDSAKVPTAPSGPKRSLYMAVGLLGGLFVAVAIVVAEDMLNTKVRDQEELEELLGVPVIGRIPAMKGGR